MKKIIFVLALVVLTGVGCNNKTNSAQMPAGENIACTMDAKQCADGSYVGRIGPNCEFAPCPTTNNTAPAATEWKTITIGGIVDFQIPAHCNADPGAGTTYITCPEKPGDTPTPEFVFSSDGIQVNMKRWENQSSPYWDETVKSMRIKTPLTHAIDIHIAQ